MINRIRRLRSWLGRLARLCARIAYDTAGDAIFYIWRFCIGFGEYPSRILFAIPVLLIAIWAAYWQFGNFVVTTADGSRFAGNPSWDDALYYSLISFTALGYGSWAPEPTGWAKWAGSVQPFIGIFSAVILSIIVARFFRRG